MYLKRLEMVGFKSFAERTRLEFEPGVTAIVGPNGCGKSNVVDAIRWCLGEMSAKSLRSKNLVDVLFNGSANRAPSNLSEVSLTFDNSQNRLPIDYSEVTVTRRLFRSGESEYFLNKTQCRLKDIKELFLDTGIGEEGYSIMEQGRVEYILSARPEERRELFEEAAGVSKYKARREEALRKMERTQLDLDRLADVIAMTKDQMDKIEAAVRKARQYQKLQEDLKSMEITHWLWDFTQLEEQIGSMKQALQVIENDLQVRTTQIAQSEAQHTELRWQDTQLGEKLVELNKKVSEIEGAIGLAEQRQSTAREREEEIHRRDAVLDAEIAQGSARREELERGRGEVRSALEAESRAAQEMAGLLEGAEAAHRERAAALKDLEEKAKSVQDALWRNNQERAGLHNEVAAQRSLEARLDGERAGLEKDRARAEESVRALETAQAEARERAEARRRELEALESSSQTSRQEVQLLEAAFGDLSKLGEELQTRLYRAQAQLEAQSQWEESDVYLQGVQAALSAGLPGVHGPVGRLITVASADEALVRRALGAHLNDLVAETLEDAQAVVKLLESQGRGRARVLVLDRLPRREAPVASGLDHRPLQDMVKTDAKFAPALHFLLGGWIASGGSLFGDGILEGGAPAPDAPVHDALARENLEKDIASVKEALESFHRQRTEQESRRQAAAESWENARRGLESARMQADFLRQEADKQKAQADLTREESRLIEAELERVRGERARAEEAARSLEARAAELAAQEEGLRAEWTGVQASVQASQAEASAASSELAVARERAGSQEERRRWREKQLADLEAELATLVSSLEAKRQERGTSQQRVEEQLHIQQEAKQSIESLLAKRHETQQALESLQTERQTLYERLNEVQNELNGLRERAEELRAQLQDKKIQESHAEFKRESIETQLREKYSLTPADARQVYGAPAQPAVMSELERLRRRVEALGAVNLTAPEEHAQLEERYNFLLSQQQDLLKAKDDLTKTIQKINTATLQNFRETFDKVRENFKLIYGQLFQGGEADIRLTDEADLLNTGVEIFAQPPGKKLLNITALSGGEKALTAVSLLFAFFMVRPAPFAVMDEVDAPLDEANVTRFIALIKTFTHQSQFLMITHNKRSMETADTLYGVTMETLGVSNILSARLKKGTEAETETPDAVVANRAEHSK